VVAANPHCEKIALEHLGRQNIWRLLSKRYAACSARASLP
jgi:hypothetical protein